MQPSSFNYFSIYVAFAVFVASVQAQVQISDYSPYDNKLLSTITNRTVSDQELLEAISRLGSVKESSSFWKSIANDSNYSINHRRRAVFALLRRHCKYCWTFADLADEIAPSKWIAESTIEKITYVIGGLPIEVKPGETVFKVAVLNGSPFYVRASGNISAEIFRTHLGGGGKLLNINPTILQYAFEDDYDEWYFRAIRK